MLKVSLYGVIGFLIGMAATSTYVVLRETAPVKVIVQEAVADSVEAEPAPKEDVVSVRAPLDVVPPAAVPLVHGHGQEKEAVAATEPVARQESVAPERLAKIFSAMRPEDAAAILTELDDDAVQSILFHLGARQAASILGNFEPERAARLSRTVLGAKEAR